MNRRGKRQQHFAVVARLMGADDLSLCRRREIFGGRRPTTATGTAAATSLEPFGDRLRRRVDVIVDGVPDVDVAGPAGLSRSPCNRLSGRRQIGPPRSLDLRDDPATAPRLADFALEDQRRLFVVGIVGHSDRPALPPCLACFLEEPVAVLAPWSGSHCITGVAEDTDRSCGLRLARWLRSFQDTCIAAAGRAPSWSMSGEESSPFMTSDCEKRFDQKLGRNCPVRSRDRPRAAAAAAALAPTRSRGGRVRSSSNLRYCRALQSSIACAASDSIRTGNP